MVARDAASRQADGDLGPIRKELNRKTSTLSARERGLLWGAATRSLWPTARRAKEGHYQDSDKCEACGDEQGTIRHALWRCPAQALLRYQEDLGATERAGAQSSQEHLLYSRGIGPPQVSEGHSCAAAEAADVGLTEDPRWDRASKVNILEGHAYTDGSLFFGEDPHRARAGYGVVMTAGVGTIDAVVYGAYLGPVQCIDAAEVHAATVAIRLSHGALTIYSDSAFVVHGWQMGRRWCTSAKRTHADIWRKFWDAAEDCGVELLTLVKVKAHATA